MEETTTITKKTCLLIDVATPADRNAMQKKQKINYNTRVYV
jgi:hypothetical protein